MEAERRSQALADGRQLWAVVVVQELIILQEVREVGDVHMLPRLLQPRAPPIVCGPLHRGRGRLVCLGDVLLVVVTMAVVVVTIRFIQGGFPCLLSLLCLQNCNEQNIINIIIL